ncbi:S26 family signal peptidase [Sphingopyxis chilensis]|uniref:S26 family signal peptidase n=1 Tax=Sphingopyxis chilensis TaxID=180400 RepID=UPI002DDD607E|nr:S26 family signal peptidase [Sphingopyxis chilensis]
MPDRFLLARALSCGALVVAIGVTIASPPRPRLVWNASASAPVGLWRVAPEAPLHRGDMVVAKLADPWRGFAAQRHYLPSNVPLIKRVSAVPGDRVCAAGDIVRINDRIAAIRHQVDRAGRSMPGWRGCHILRRDEVMLLMDAESSFDGRYFGPTRSGDIIGKATPLWPR